MQPLIIEIPPGARYIEDLPFDKNCIINKGITGCGATTQFLKNDRSTVFVFPNVSNIQNKLAQFTNTEGDGNLTNPMAGFYYESGKGSMIEKLICGKTEINIKYLRKDLEKCRNAGTPPKILVTIDSLPIIMNEINPNEFTIVIDEVSKFITDLRLRYWAIFGVLENFKKFKNYIFLTATLPDTRFWPEEFKNIPVIEYRWPGVDPLKVNTATTNNIKKTAINLVNYFILSGCQENCYIFINLVGLIEKIVKSCDLKDSDYSIIFSQNRNEKLNRWSHTGSPTKVTFSTASGHESIDIIDENAIVYVITDTFYRRSTTLMAPTIDIPQIAGRFRKIKKAITHIIDFSSSYTDLSKDVIEENFNYEYLKEIQNVNSNEKINPDKLLFHVVDKKENKLKLVPELKKHYLYEEEKKTYYSSREKLEEAYRSAGFEVVHVDPEFQDFEPWMEYITAPLGSFKKSVIKLKEIEEILNKDHLWLIVFKTRALKKFWYLEPALKELGYSGIEKIGYNITTLKNKFKGYANKPVVSTPPLELLRNEMDKFIGEKISLSFIKSVFEKINNSIGYNHFGPAASDLKNYYIVTECYIYENGRQIRSYEILSPR